MFGFLRRKKKPSTTESPVGEMPLGLGEEGEEGFGGPHFYRAEIAERRWIAQREAVNVINAEPDPLLWRDAQMVFEIERGLAHGHEGLRDRLSNYVADQVTSSVGDLYHIAADVAQSRLKLEEVDRDLNRVSATWNEMYREVEKNPIEIGRYYRLRSWSTMLLKYLMAIVFVFSEFLLSYELFKRFASDNPLLVALFCMGTLLIFIVLPHYAAHGLKEGLTKQHSYERQQYIDRGERPSVIVSRNHHMEEQDDRGFRTLSVVICVVLVLLMIPFSRLRALELGDGRWVWFAFFFLLQFAISGYFFLREWLDHGYPSNTLHRTEETKAGLERKRQDHLKTVTRSVANFFESAQDVVIVLREAPRWDNYIVSSYLETIHYFRHLVTVGRPELAPFIAGARIPALSSGVSAGKNLDLTSDENPALLESNLFGSTWLMHKVADALAAVPAVDPVTGRAVVVDSDRDVSWVLTNSPAHLLQGFLDYFGLGTHYVRPTEPTHPEAITSDLGLPILPEDVGGSREGDDGEVTSGDLSTQEVPSDGAPSPIGSNGVQSADLNATV